MNSAPIRKCESLTTDVNSLFMGVQVWFTSILNFNCFNFVIDTHLNIYQMRFVVVNPKLLAPGIAPIKAFIIVFNYVLFTFIIRSDG